MTLSLFVSMFFVGLATSVHCISMCGPMVVTYAVKGDDTGGWNRRLMANAAYQGGKLVSYVFVGVLLGAVGSALNLDGIRPWAMLGAGVFMVIIGLGMTGKVPWATRLTPRPPRMLINAIGNLRRKANEDAAAGETSLATPVSFGLLTGLMPCAPLMAAEIAAASSGHPVTGGFIMLAFGLGTLPLLFAFGTASSLIPRGWRERLTFVLAFVVLGLGLVFMNRSAMLMGFPVNSHSIQAAILGTPDPHSEAAPEYTAGADGVVEVELTVTSSGFQPANLQIPSDQPVRLIVTRVGNDVCSEQLFFPNIGIKQDLAPDSVTVVDLPATGSGSYTMTCGMGMFAGQLIAGEAAAAFEIPSWYWLALGFGAVAAAYWLAAGIRPRVEGAPQPALALAGAAPLTPVRKPTKVPAGTASKAQTARGTRAKRVTRTAETEGGDGSAKTTKASAKGTARPTAGTKAAGAAAKSATSGRTSSKKSGSKDSARSKGAKK